MTKDQEIQQKLQELNAASNAFDRADKSLKNIDPGAASEIIRTVMNERTQAVERYVAAKEWLYAHTDGIMYDSSTNSFVLRNFRAPSEL